MTSARIALALFATCVLGAQEALPLDLPPAVSGGATLADVLSGRKTVRTLRGPGLTLAETAQLLWAAQGENRPGKRTVPSAHGKYAVEMYLLTAGNPTLAAGFYHYQAATHQLKKLTDGTPSATLGKVVGMQPWIAAAPAVFLVTGVPTRIDPLLKGNALAFTYYEGGAAAQDLLLQAVALGLDAGTAGGLNMEALAKAVEKLPKDTQILTVLPVGRGAGPNS